MKIENFEYLTENDSVKFVAGSLKDLNRAKYIIDNYKLLEQGITVFISPVFGKIVLSQIVSFMKDNRLNDIKMQLQMHKVIWHPSARGV